MGVADFGTLFLATAIKEKAKGVPLINIGQIVFRSSQTLIARKSSGIDSWPKVNGRKVGLWDSELSVLPMALFRKSRFEVKTIPQALTVNLFLRGGVDVVSAMWYNEYHTILSAGVEPGELTVFHLSDFGMNFPEDGIYCLEETFRKDPEVCCRFVRASFEGWRYAFEHQDEALEIVMRHANEANTATNRWHQKWMLDQMREVIDVKVPYPGRLTESDYNAVAQELAASGLIERIPPFSEFSVNCGASHEK